MAMGFVLQLIGSISSFMLFYSPGLALARIVRNRAVEGFTPYPYAGLFLSCAVGIICSLKAVTGRSNQMNFEDCLTGLFVEGLIVMVFTIYASKGQRACVVTFVLVGLFVIVRVLVSIMIFYPVKVGRAIMRSILTVFTIISYLLPLGVCVTFMPLLPILALMLKSAIFIVISVEEKDMFVLTSSIVGVVSDTVQVIFFVAFFLIERAAAQMANMATHMEHAQGLLLLHVHVAQQLAYQIKKAVGTFGLAGSYLEHELYVKRLGFNFDSHELIANSICRPSN